MSFYRVKTARFAETIRIGDNGDEIRYIDIGEKQFERFTMTYHDGMLWIYDQKTNKMFTTSSANLRMMIMLQSPKEVMPETKRKEQPKD